MIAPSIREAVARAIAAVDYFDNGFDVCEAIRDDALNQADAALAVALPLIVAQCREHFAGVVDPVTPPGSTDYDKQAYDIRRNVAAAIRADEGPK